MEPGFTTEQEQDELGTKFALPEWLENEREEIKSHLLSFEKQLLLPTCIPSIHRETATRNHEHY